jgi:hypothetical protein
MAISVAVMNKSTVLTDKEVQDALPAFQHQVNYDFKQYWDVDARLHFFKKGTKPPTSMWRAEIKDSAGKYLLGWHGDDPTHQVPDLVIGAKDDEKAGVSWTVTFSHELLEFLADPWANRYAQVYVDDNSGPVFCALEVCDPVEADDLGYRIDGVLVSDFVTPAWFHPNPDRAPKFQKLDFMGHVKKPFQLTNVGYMILWSPGTQFVQRMMVNGELQDTPMPSTPNNVGPGELRPRPSMDVRRDLARQARNLRRKARQQATRPKP